MLKVIKRSIPVVAILAVIILGAACDYASAMQQKSDFVVRVKNSLSLIVPKKDILLMLNPDNKVVVADSVNVEVRTNNKNGATVFASTNKNDGRGEIPYHTTGNHYENFSSSTSLIGRNTKGAIPTIRGNYTTDYFPEAAWGVSIDGENYKGIGNKSEPTELYSIDGSGESSAQEVYFGAKAGDNLLSDYYENTVIFTAVAAYSPKTTKDIVFMQEIDEEVADSMLPNMQYQLRDMRDNKKYWVAKLDDGNIWMTQNLDLDLSAGITLTPKDTDIAADWTPSKSTIEATQTINDGWANSITAPYSYGIINKDSRTEVAGYITNPISSEIVDGRYAFPYGTYKTKEECIANVVNAETCEHYNVGKYYNWAATIATNDATAVADDTALTTIEQSICPANWRLPTGSSGSSIKGEYTVLLEKANVASSQTLESGNTVGYYIANTSNALVNAPLFFTNAGTKSSGKEIEHAYGEYWTSSIRNGSSVDRFAFDRRGESSQSMLNTNYYPGGNDNFVDLGVGRSIRCLAKGMYTHTLKYFIGNAQTGEQTVTNSLANYSMVFNPPEYSNADNYIPYNNKYVVGWSYSCYEPNQTTYRQKIFPGDLINVGTAECRADATLADGQRVSFHGNGGTFDGASDNTLLLSKIQKSTSSLMRVYDENCTSSYYNNEPCYSYVRKSNRDENGYAYISSLDPADAVNLDFGDSTYVDVTLKYGFEYSGDRLCFLAGYYTPASQWNGETIACDKVFTGTTSTTTTTFRIYNNIISVRFAGNSSDSYFGFWADFAPENGFSHSIVVGNVKIPSRDGYEFLGWSTDPNATTPNFDFDPGHNEYPEDLELYAVWAATGVDYHTLIVSADKNVTNMTIKQDSMAGTSISGNRYGSMFVFTNLAKGSNYYLVPEFESGYEFDSWRKVDSTAGAALSATDVQNAYYKIGDGDSAIILNSKRGLLAMQNFVCNLYNVGDTTELVDTRDGSVYTVAKLADGKCWMTDNLRLELSKLREDITPRNTNNPTPEFINMANTRPMSLSVWCTTNSAKCDNSIAYKTTNINDVTSSDSYGNVYDDYGVYYNWFTATAGHGTYETDSGDSMAGDICPAGWHIPTGGTTSGEYYILNNKINGTQNNSTAVNNLHNAPNNFVFNGYLVGNNIAYRGSYGSYWTSNAASSSMAYQLSFNTSNITPNYSSTNRTNASKYAGAAIRCLANGSNIVYDANDGSGRRDIQRKITTGESVYLYAFSNKRSGYILTGWNTKADGTGTSYAPGEMINMPSTNGEDLVLYAQWMVSQGTLQNFSCSSLAMGSVTALTDVRDDEVYAVAKLADGKCWMIDDLRLDFTKLKEEISATNTNNPTAAFITAAATHPASGYNNRYYYGATYPLGYDTRNIGDYTIDQYGYTYDQYGVYYNWSTATAGHGTGAHNVPATPGDLCPYGWRLPDAGINNDFSVLNNAIINNDDISGSEISARWLSYPNRFHLAGQIISNRDSFGNWGVYWASSSVYGSSNFDIASASRLTPTGFSVSSEPKDYMELMRCLSE